MFMFRTFSVISHLFIFQHDPQVFNNSLYWNWLRTVFLPGVYAGFWYNRQVETRSMYIGNKRSVLVGMPRLRQLRVKPSK